MVKALYYESTAGACSIVTWLPLRAKMKKQTSWRSLKHNPFVSRHNFWSNFLFFVFVNCCGWHFSQTRVFVAESENKQPFAWCLYVIGYWFTIGGTFFSVVPSNFKQLYMFLYFSSWFFNKCFFFFINQNLT